MSDLTCLSASQREAVTFGEGPLLLLAGPGSGKTFTITQRILYLIRERRITPEKLLVITFTREAALSMRQRFAQISPQEVHTVNFGTFHSVFYQILLQSGRISSGNILNDRQKKDLILPILKKITDCKKRSAAEVTELAGNYLAAIGYYKNTGDIENSRKKLPEEEKQHFSRIYESYEEARKNTGGLDFEDMLKECEEFLQRDPVQRTYWQNRFEYILIDEFQDINYRQYSIVKILAEKHRNIFAVGDDDQAIYGFRGARPACMRQFVEEFGAKQILLRTNYRSHPDIVEASLAVIDENKEYAEQEYASNPDMVEYTFDRDILVARSDETVLSMAVMESSYLGGAHPFCATIGRTYDTQTGKELSLKDVVSDYDGIYEYVKTLSSGKSSPLLKITDNYHYHTVQADAAFVLPDGGPLSGYSRKHGFPEAERVEQ